MGVSVCEACHKRTARPGIYPFCHHVTSTMFSNGIELLEQSYKLVLHQVPTRWICTNASARLTTGSTPFIQKDNGLAVVWRRTNYAAMPANLQNWPIFQCENCHETRLRPSYAFGQYNTPGWPLLEYLKVALAPCLTTRRAMRKGPNVTPPLHSVDQSTAATFPPGAAATNACSAIPPSVTLPHRKFHEHLDHDFPPTIRFTTHRLSNCQNPRPDDSHRRQSPDSGNGFGHIWRRDRQSPTRRRQPVQKGCHQ